jgi:hypothetical protein
MFRHYKGRTENVAVGENMNREANFRQIVKTSRVTDEPMPGQEIKTYGDARRDAILWADEEIERLTKELDTACAYLSSTRKDHYWGWNESLKQYGYFVRGAWIGENLRDVIRLKAAEAKEVSDE